ncbi:MAG: DUF4388 domain-containing protein [Thermoanaerobaculia bacterium]|nr:DUF4388 domain-containing protein [Thermoanaerobaculia bacterium]
MAFQGSLKELPLPDVIQLVAVSGKTGAFWIEDRGERGKIYLREGRIVHAETDTLVGEEAVYELATWTEAEFRFDPDDPPSRSTIERSNTSLLIEAARRTDEWRILAKRVGSTKMVPVRREDDPPRGVSLTPREQRVMQQIDGRSSIEAIAGKLDDSAFEVAKIVYDLINSGVVRLEEKGAA